MLITKNNKGDRKVYLTIIYKISQQSQTIDFGFYGIQDFGNVRTESWNQDQVHKSEIIT